MKFEMEEADGIVLKMSAVEIREEHRKMFNRVGSRCFDIFVEKNGEMYMEEDHNPFKQPDWTKQVLVMSVVISDSGIHIVRGASCSDGMYDFFLEQLGP